MIVVSSVAVLCGVVGLFMLEHRMQRTLERDSFRYANHYFSDQYFDHRFRGDRYIKLQGHRFIYRRRGHRKIISVYQIQRVECRWFRLSVRLLNGRRVTLPTGFRHQPYIYAILKYHRPVGRDREERSVLSTRKSVAT